MNTEMCFPGIKGNDALRARLARDIISGSGLAHAYVIEGRPGSGRRTMAKNIAAALCCERAGSGLPLPCGECPACRKIFAGISPDVITVTREDGKASIGIDTIRDLRTDVHVMPNELDSKIYIIEDADTMTAQAQNALLLTLEEPPAYLVFLLIAENSRNMLETIRSRAPSLRMQPLPPETVAAIAAESSAEAARMRTEDRNAFRGIIMAADGSAGRAIELFEGKEKDAVTARRAAATEFCRIACSRGHGRELLSVLFPYSSAIVVTRISGPLVSIMIGMAGLTRCTISTIRVAPSSVTWAELIRITSIPASKSFATNSSVQRKSDMVATILVFFMRYIWKCFLIFNQSKGPRCRADTNSTRIP